MNKKGYRLEKGFLMDYAWEHSMRAPDAETFKALYFAMVDYQRSSSSAMPKET